MDHPLHFRCKICICGTLTTLWDLCQLVALFLLASPWGLHAFPFPFPGLSLSPLISFSTTTIIFQTIRLYIIANRKKAVFNHCVAVLVYFFRQIHVVESSMLHQEKVLLSIQEIPLSLVPDITQFTSGRAPAATTSNHLISPRASTLWLVMINRSGDVNRDNTEQKIKFSTDAS